MTSKKKGRDIFFRYLEIISQFKNEVAHVMSWSCHMCLCCSTHLNMLTVNKSIHRHSCRLPFEVPSLSARRISSRFSTRTYDRKHLSSSSVSDYFIFSKWLRGLRESRNLFYVNRLLGASVSHVLRH